VPPKQCPECRRFLVDAFIEALDVSGTPCPRCGGTLTASMFEDGDAQVLVPAGGAGDEVSIRPPDLEPEAVRDRSLDVLAGWEVGVGEAEIASWRQDRRPVPVDTLTVLGAGAAGVLLGLLLVPQRRVRGASLGALAGIVGAAAVRRVWVLRA
jgi:hypothetical protein